MHNTQSLAQPTLGANPLTTACDLPPNQITNITVFADKYPQTRLPYWDVKAQAEVQYAKFILMSDCNLASELGDRNTFCKYVKSLVCHVFNHDEEMLEPVQDIAIKFTHKSYGKQSEMRYMNPKYEGYVRLTVTSAGVKDRLGYNTLTQFDLKFFIIGHHTQEQFESSAKALLSPLAREAWDRDFKL